MILDPRIIKPQAYYSRASAAQTIGCGYEVLRRARKEGRILTLRENRRLVTGSQLLAFVEAPDRVKTKINQ